MFDLSRFFSHENLLKEEEKKRERECGGKEEWGEASIQGRDAEWMDDERSGGQVIWIEVYTVHLISLLPFKYIIKNETRRLRFSNSGPRRKYSLEYTANTVL